MPCSSSEGMGGSDNDEVRLLKKEVDKLTRLICEVLRALVGDKPMSQEASQEVAEWMNRHTEWDKKHGRG